jgi:3'-phosphoadenosine 5'-phosphosulfate sulfotransferase (PAPS reductase)/FAD synthetase
LSGKIQYALEIIRDSLSKSINPFVAFSGGKRSVVVLHLVKTVTGSRVKTLFIDTSDHFAEIYHFIEKMYKLWGFDLVKVMNHTFVEAVRQYDIDCLFTGTRGAESNDGTGSDLLPEVRPLALFTDDDIWDYIRSYNLPYCSLCRKGFKSESKRRDESKNELLAKQLKDLGYM